MSEYGEMSLREALWKRKLTSRPGGKGRVLVQRGRVIGPMTASVGWALVRLIDGNPTTDCRRCDVYAAKVLMAEMEK